MGTLAVTVPEMREGPAHAPWSPEQVRLAHFARWLVFTGRLSDGETTEDLALERKVTHQFSGRRHPSNWTGLDAWAFENRALVAPPNYAPDAAWPD